MSVDPVENTDICKCISFLDNIYKNSNILFLILFFSTNLSRRWRCWKCEGHFQAKIGPCFGMYANQTIVVSFISCQQEIRFYWRCSQKVFVQCYSRVSKVMMTLKVEPINFYMSEKQLTQAFYCRTLSLYCKEFWRENCYCFDYLFKIGNLFTKSYEIWIILSQNKHILKL